MVVLKKRVKALEKSQQEMLEYLKSIGAAMKPAIEQNLSEEKPIHQLPNEPDSEPSVSPLPVKISTTEDKAEAVLEGAIQNVFLVEKGEKTQASVSGSEAEKGETSPVGPDGKRGTTEGPGNAEEGPSATPEASQHTETSTVKTEEEKEHGTKETAELPAETEESGIPQASLFNEEENRALLREEEERRWNTPPELIPEEVVRRPETTNEQLRSLIAPITTNINIGAGENSHSLGLQLGLQSVSLSQGNAFSQPLYDLMGPSLSGSQSASFSAGFTGISAASAQSFGYNGPILGTQGKTDSQSFNFGKATASSVTSSANGHASSAAQSSVSLTQSAASSGRQTGGFSDGATVNIHRPGRQQIRPTWTNISPNYGPNDRQSRAPTLKVDVRPSGTRNQRPVTLHISSRPTNRRDQKPTVQIYKPRLDGTAAEDRNQWSKGESVVSPGLQIAVVSSGLQRPASSSGASHGGIDIRGMNLRWPEK